MQRVLASVVPLCGLLMTCFASPAQAAQAPAPGEQQLTRKIAALPQKLNCLAYETAGFHDFPHNPGEYEAVVFFESKFELHVNRVLMTHLVASSSYDLFLTLHHEDEIVELQCTQVRGAGDAVGVSCSSQPPADLLLLNLDSLRFTRTDIGGWTFASQPTDAGKSIYVEYGRCTKS